MAFELQLGLTRFGVYPGTTAVSEAIFTMLREGLVGRTFGSAVQEIAVDLHLPWRGAPPHPFSAADIQQYHRLLAELPKVTFQRKRARAVVAWATALETEAFLGPAAQVSPATFEALASEVQRALSALQPRFARIADFDLDALRSSVKRTVAAVPKEPAAFRATVATALAAARSRWKVARRARGPWELLDIDWSTYHPDARALLDDPFFWDCADDLAPVGNDTGADILEGYRAWRRRKKNASVGALAYLCRVLAEWEVPLEGSDGKLALVRDEACVALAFSQIMLEGRVESEVAECALQAITRQRPTIGDWPDSVRREQALARTGDAIKRVLERSRGANGR